MKSFTLLSLLLLFAAKTVIAQDTSKLDKALSFPEKLFTELSKKTGSTTRKLEAKTDHYLTRLERKEKRLYKKLYKKDSLLAKQTFGNIDSSYAALRNGTSAKGKASNVYSGHLDSLNTALNFLQQKQLVNNPELQKSLESFKSLQGRLNASEQIKRQLQARQKLIKEQFQKLGMVKQLKGLQKDVYYYSAQIKEYKKAFEDPSKLEQKLMDLAMNIPEFKEFFRKNSRLGSMFAIPGGNSSTTLTGLQTRASVSQLLVQRFGSSATTTQTLRQNVQSAQSQLNQLQNKITQFKSGSYGNSNADASDFKPNTQKTKSFLHRLEFGCNVQSQKSRSYFPVTTDLGLSLSYKLNDKSVIGIGGSYKLGLGSGWNNLKLSHQGVGVRSYLDYKLKGNFYFSGGYEQNYLSDFKTIQQLQNYSSWQSSGLIGLSKRYKINKKVKGEMKLLWDFLSYQQIPRTQAILFRVGYSLK